ncbi:PTS sugar transporter subunit IIA [Enterococcus sp. 669A]|uniref:PTS sugar transporter subunit IIA n=1 Tax=Candidatus Enterococcus moelleringii TaxID=2815325 RepID=A0ABS3LA76_9ENTE|nr:fructose PTS transporter subunit IIA [Enterococcus sp. 669A]MBO1305641.1 PTS sugar transporter subunit IIA [Enterococcus sp. 669A]
MEKIQESNKGVISTDLIYLDSELDNQDAVLQFIVENSEFVGYVEEADELYEAVKRREAEVPTAIGYDIAIPHGKTEAVIHPFIAFLRTKEAFQWTTKTEEMVRLVFLIGVPETSEGKLHLKFISQLSKKLLDDEFRAKLLTETDKNKIFEQLNAISI